MEAVSSFVLLGDSVLKGIQVDPETQRYVTNNVMVLPALAEEFHISIQNKSVFGADCSHGEKLLDRLLHKGEQFDAVIMDFGGNDCNYPWAEVAEHPEAEHHPNVPLDVFIQQYRQLIRKVKDGGMQPILCTLPPLLPESFLSWWCRGIDEAVVRNWLGSACNIYAHQERYSRAVERLAQEENTPLIDLRSAFLAHVHLEQVICTDGTHPNSAGQKLIAQALREFLQSYLQP